MQTVLIDSSLENGRPLDGYAAVAIDVIRASTTAITAVALGRRCFPVSSLDAALALKRNMPDALLAGEIGGSMPYGFDMNNSPSAVAACSDIVRPLILLSTSGTRLMERLERNGPAYVACFRNYLFTAQYLAENYARVAIIGAVSRSEFRDEDQMCCAWIAEALADCGFQPEDENTRRLIARWSGAPCDAFLGSKSVQYLRDTGQEEDLEFVLSHFNDLNAAFPVHRSEIIVVSERGLPELNSRDVEPQAIELQP